MPTGTYTRKLFTRTHRENISKGCIKQFFCSVASCNDKHLAKGLCKKHYNEQYRQNNKKKHIQYCKAHKEKTQKYNKQYREEHKEKTQEYMKQWRENNPMYDKQYYQTPKGKIIRKANYHKRRTLLKDLTKEIVQRVYEHNILKYGKLTCCLCFKPIKFGDDSLEHLTPLSRKGTNDFNNLGIAHLNCNVRKHTLTLEEWYAKEKYNEKVV